MNKHIIIAAFTRDPELRYTPSGTAVFEGTLSGERTVRVPSKTAVPLGVKKAPRRTQLQARDCGHR